MALSYANPQDSPDLFRALMGSRVLQSLDDAGTVWTVEITKAGTCNGNPPLDWPAEVLARDKQVFQGIPSYVNHLTDKDVREGRGHPIKDLLGHIENPRMGDEGLIGDLHLLNPQEWGPKFRAFQKLPAGIAGMSMDVRFIPAKERGPGGRQRVSQIVRHPLNSLDLVTPPGGGGRILRAVASAGYGRWEEVKVEPAQKKSEERMDYEMLLVAQQALADMRVTRLAKTFGLTHEVRREIERDGVWRVVQGERFRDDPRPYSSLREAYIDISGDVNCDRLGRHVRVAQEMSLPSFELAMADVCNRLMMADYDGNVYDWRRIVTSISNVPDFRINYRERFNYAPDLPDMQDDSTYTEIEPSGNPAVDQQVSYQLNSKGGMITFTRRALLNDDIGAMKRAVQQVARSASRTLAKRVWNLVMSNSTYGVDSLAVFCATHGNYGLSALSIETMSAAKTAMLAQAESNSTDSLGVGTGALLLVVPGALEATARQLNYAQFDDTGSLTAANPWLHRFGKDAENIFVNPLLTNANDWYLFDISGIVPLIEVGFLNGKVEPQVTVHDDPLDGTTFTQDRVTFKVQHDYECALLDYRGMYKGTVSGS